MSERLSPQQMLGMLNDYFDRMSAIVERHGGVIDKYVGDAIMALFGAPARRCRRRRPRPAGRARR